jgi:hypothetical protein
MVEGRPPWWAKGGDGQPEPDWDDMFKGLSLQSMEFSSVASTLDAWGPEGGGRAGKRQSVTFAADVDVDGNTSEEDDRDGEEEEEGPSHSIAVPVGGGRRSSRRRSSRLVLPTVFNRRPSQDRRKSSLLGGSGLGGFLPAARKLSYGRRRSSQGSAVAVRIDKRYLPGVGVRKLRGQKEGMRALGKGEEGAEGWEDEIGAAEELKRIPKGIRTLRKYKLILKLGSSV